MKLFSFQIKNYRSITDTGVVELSKVDNITVLAGQNESGKSSILTALRDFEDGEFDIDSVPFSTGSDPIQSVSCTYRIENSNNFQQLLNKSLIEENKVVVETDQSIVDFKKIDKITRFTLTRTREGSNYNLTLDETTFNIIQSSILDKPITPSEVEEKKVVAEDENTPPESPKKYLEFDTNEQLAEIIFSITPQIVFFDDFCDLLPDKILVSDLRDKKTDVKGYKAVSNLGKILKADFTTKDKEEDAVRKTKEEQENTSLSVDFQNDWGQRIHGENEVLVEYDYQKRAGDGAEGSYINFYVQTKKGQRLPPKQRSKGLIWFLSLWMELKALDSGSTDLILLLDEPDQHLHVKAQDDILKLINKLTNGEGSNNDQIVYATHSPYLIETDHLSRVKLVINDEKDGTTIEDVVTSKIDTEYKIDALQPISDAIGLSVSGFSIFGKKNVLLEGISDFYYFTAMKKVLNRAGDYSFIPGVGVRKINNLISICLGYGLEWLSIIDDDPKNGGKDSKTKFKEIADYLFDGDKTKTSEKVLILKDVVGIENMFTIKDFELIDSNLGNQSDMCKVVGKKRKVLFSKLFLEKVVSGEITKTKLSNSTIKKFETAFDFIQEGFAL